MIPLDVDLGLEHGRLVAPPRTLFRGAAGATNGILQARARVLRVSAGKVSSAPRWAVGRRLLPSTGTHHDVQGAPQTGGNVGDAVCHSGRVSCPYPLSSLSFRLTHVSESEGLRLVRRAILRGIGR